MGVIYYLRNARAFGKVLFSQVRNPVTAQKESQISQIQKSILRIDIEVGGVVHTSPRFQAGQYAYRFQ